MPHATLDAPAYGVNTMVPIGADLAAGNYFVEIRLCIWTANRFRLLGSNSDTFPSACCVLSSAATSLVNPFASGARAVYIFS